jgi:pullulanase
MMNSFRTKTYWPLFTGLLFFVMLSVKSRGKSVESPKIIKATISTPKTIRVTSSEEKFSTQVEQYNITPFLSIKSINKETDGVTLSTDPIDLSEFYKMKYKEQEIGIEPGEVLDQFHSDKALGFVWNEDRTIFRIFAPRASKVTLVMFDTHTSEAGTEYEMLRDVDGVWEWMLPGQYFGQYYAYRIDGPHHPSEWFDPEKLICDPYSRAVVTKNEYLHRGKTLIIDTSRYDWDGDTWVKIDPRDLLIYECHVRDMTAHPSAGLADSLAGTYKGFIQEGIKGGIEYIKSLGVNAVELLPVQEFGNIELPYETPVGDVTNTWNPYARNHWGYMTSYFFAPESYYATGNSMEKDGYTGIDGRQVDEFKDLIKACHKAGIAVIMDVVYNHVSQYDQNCFKHIDKKYYFRLNDDLSFSSTSGCGNDFKTERPMARRLILDSILYWMKEYHIDGFRFDLAAMIDWETVDQITAAARAINPEVILIAEPWGGGKYEPAAFSQHGWAAWNDQIRNGVKGQNPGNGFGYIFGKWWDYNNLTTMKRYVLGNLVEDGGLFMEKAHNINYLESHDDHTFGDFVRLALGEVSSEREIADLRQHVELTEKQMKVNKLGALFLMCSQGAVMIHEGQEYARSKVIAPSDTPDEHIGRIDHNSYNKDNETNWLNFEHADINRKLVDYYCGLIALRKAHPIFTKSGKSDFSFIECENPFAFGFYIDKAGSGDRFDFFVLLNGHADSDAEFDLPPGPWSVLVDAETAGTSPLRILESETIILPPTSGMILRR